MITAKEILRLLDAGGPEPFEEFAFFHESWKNLDLITYGLLKDIKALIEAQKNLDATIDYARNLPKESE